MIPIPPSDEPNTEKREGGNEDLSILTYNVLAETYTLASNYFYCPEFARRWNYRCQRIVEEIEFYSPDIACMQEVDHFDFFSSKLEKLGYKGVFVRRGRMRLDGSCIFYKDSKLNLVNYIPIYFNELAKMHDNKHRYMKDNIAVLAAFSWKNAETKNKSFVVATTHLLWDPKFQDVKLEQAGTLLEKLRQFTTGKDYGPIFACGDLNSVPEGEVYETFKDSTLEFQSAYSAFDEPPTHFTPTYAGCLDYILFNKDVQLKQVLEPLPKEILDKPDTFPSVLFPSDHVPLMASFEFSERKPEGGSSGS